MKYNDFKYEQFYLLKRCIIFLILLAVSEVAVAFSLSEPVERNDWLIEYLAPPEVEFINVKIMQSESDSLYVSGRVRRALDLGQHGGYVTVALFAPGSSTAGFTKSSPYLPLAGHHRLHGEYFRLDIPLIPTKSAKIVMQYVKQEN